MTREEYIAAFPNYCGKCQGWGALKSLSPTIQIRGCECMEGKTCPRCGSKNGLDEMYVCVDCQWNMDDKERGLPGSIVI